MTGARAGEAPGSHTRRAGVSALAGPAEVAVGTDLTCAPAGQRGRYGHRRPRWLGHKRARVPPGSCDRATPTSR